MHGEGRLAEHAADYVIRYADGSEARAAIRRRHQVGTFQRRWGENCFEAVAQHKPNPRRAGHEQPTPSWGWSQTRVVPADDGPWVNWLWAWENPHPEKAITGFRFEPATGVIVISAISAGDVATLPLRWQSRRKACLILPEGEPFRPELDGDGLLEQIRIDLGQVISATPRLVYPHDAWPDSYNNQLPELSVAAREILIEYTAHPEACFHLSGPAGGRVVPVSEVEGAGLDGTAPAGGIHPVAPAEQTVTLRVVERGRTQPVPVKLHIHGAWGEYLAPVDRHRILNPAWFEDTSADFAHILSGDDWVRGHACAYIRGETAIKLPLGKVYIEVSKGFEIRPVRKVVEITPETQEIEIELEKVLPWREQGWVTADTHVHFLSPMTAMLEGAAEGRERDQPAGQPVGRADDQRGRLRRPQHLGLERSRRGRRIPGARGHREPPARAGAHLAAGLPRADHRADDHRRPGRIGPGRPGRDPPDRVGAAVPQPGRPCGGAALPEPARRARRGHRERRCRRDRDDLLGGPLQRHRPLFHLRLVPLPELRLPGPGCGRHGQDGSRHRRGDRAHLRPHRPERRIRLRDLEGGGPPRRDLRHLRPAARFHGGRPAHGEPDRDDLPGRHGGRGLAGRQRHHPDDALSSWW